MEKTKTAGLLDDLSPTTQYADFLKIWPDVETALSRNINRKAIWNKLKTDGGLEISYVTFTRFVKKALGNPPSEKPGRSNVIPQPASLNLPEEISEPILTDGKTKLESVLAKPPQAFSLKQLQKNAKDKQ